MPIKWTSIYIIHSMWNRIFKKMMMIDSKSLYFNSIFNFHQHGKL